LIWFQGTDLEADYSKYCMSRSSFDQGKMITEILKDDGQFPNNGELPLVVYEAAVELPDDDPAAGFELLFKLNGWENSWRNGIYDYHHYHSTAHEVLGIYEGTVKLQLGGPKGLKVDLKKGDVVIIPAGVAHRNIGSSKDFKCVGAYPKKQDYDMNYGKEGERPKADKNIQNLPLPVMDPVYGLDGQLIREWTSKK
jgi:uncharacterized protein YjlB